MCLLFVKMCSLSLMVRSHTFGWDCGLCVCSWIWDKRMYMCLLCGVWYAYHNSHFVCGAYADQDLLKDMLLAWCGSCCVQLVALNQTKYCMAWLTWTIVYFISISNLQNFLQAYILYRVASYLPLAPDEFVSALEMMYPLCGEGRRCNSIYRYTVLELELMLFLFLRKS